jgi:transposase
MIPRLRLNSIDLNHYAEQTIFLFDNHESLAVTQKYISLGGKGLREAIDLLDDHHKPQQAQGRGMPWDHQSHKMSWEKEEFQSAADKKRQAGK